MNAIAFSSNVFGHFGFVEALGHIRNLGFKAIDLWSCPVLANHVEPTRDDPARLREVLAAHGIAPVCMSIFYAIREEKLARFRLAQQLNVPYVCFTGAPTPDYHEKMTGMNVIGRTLTEPGAGWDTFIKVLRELLDRAHDCGVRIALQAPHVYTLVETAADLKRLREAIDHPALYFTLSPTHALARGSTVDELVDICGDRLAVLHLWNVKRSYVANNDDRRWGTPAEQLAFKGYFDFEPLVAKFAGRDLPHLCVKCHGTESSTDAAAISATVRDAIAGLDGALARAKRAENPGRV